MPNNIAASIAGVAKAGIRAGCQPKGASAR